VARLDRLVSRLLELSRIEASSEAMMLVDLEALLLRVAERASGPAHEVKLDYQAGARILRAREADLETAFLNLLDNAVRFSPEGKAVTITARGDAPFVEVLVRDEGPGISPKNLPKVFDRFFTTDSDRNGTGLGLSIVKAVIEAHGGKVRVESEVGKGTTFAVKLALRR